MLSNAYFLAKFRFDTAENEPAKNLQNFVNLPILLTLERQATLRATGNGVREARAAGRAELSADGVVCFVVVQKAVVLLRS